MLFKKQNYVQQMCQKCERKPQQDILFAKSKRKKLNFQKCSNWILKNKCKSNL